MRISAILDRLDLSHREIVRGASVALLLKLLAGALTFGLGLVVARTLGAHGAGLYFLASSVVVIAGVVGRLGLDLSLLRFTAAGAAVEDWPRVEGAYRRGLRVCLVGSALTSVAVLWGAPWLAVDVLDEPALTVVLRWMALAVVPLALYNIHAQLLRGLDRIAWFLWVVGVVHPAVTIVGVILLASALGVRGAAISYLCGAIVAAALGKWLWKRATPMLSDVTGDVSTRTLLDTSIPLFWVALMNQAVVHAPLIVLGLWVGAEEVGIFGVATRTAALTSFVLSAVNAVVAPRFGALHERGQREQLSRTVRFATTLMTAVALPLLVVMLVFPGWIMGIFGSEFVDGGPVLAVLAIGQFFNVALGSVTYVLIMCGEERITRDIAVLSAVVIVGLNVLLDPYLGVMGAAIATSVTLILNNVIGAVYIKRRLGILTLPHWRIWRI